MGDAEPEVAALEQLRALSDAAWPGPWVDHTIGADAWIHAAPGSVVIADLDPSTTAQADARFIVAAVNYVRAALAAARQHDR